MNKEINLLPYKRKNFLEENRIVKYFRMSSILLLSAISLLSITLYFLKSTSELPSLQKEETAALTTLTGFHAKTAKYILINERVQNISDILKKRNTFDTTMSSILDLIPLDVSITSFSIDKEFMTIIVSSPSLLSLNTFLESFVGVTAEKKFFKKIFLDSISTNTKNGLYSIALSANMQ